MEIVKTLKYLLEHNDELIIQKNPDRYSGNYAEYKYQAFTIRTQHIYGNTVEEIFDQIENFVPIKHEIPHFFIKQLDRRLQQVYEDRMKKPIN